jgi:hypothetical protein
MSSRKGWLLVFAVVTLFAVLGVVAWRGHHTATLARRVLAKTVFATRSVRIYDIAFFGVGFSSNDISSAISAQFPVEVFSNAAASAEYHNPSLGLWKQTSLAVLTLRDGSQRRACFHYDDGSFALEDLPGYYTVLGGGNSEFNSTFMRLIQKQFVPKRYERSKTPN